MKMKGFVELPYELLVLEILSYFPAVKVTLEESTAQKLERRYTLQSLSAVCRRFRQVFRPLLWQRIEVYDGIRIGDYELSNLRTEFETELFAKELLRQLNVVTNRAPDLAQYVRFVDIVVKTATSRTVFEQLGRCFSLFPNLYTVKIFTTTCADVDFEQKIAEGSKRGFKLRTPFPQIRSAILSRPVYHLLRVCPNLESLATFNSLPRESMYTKVWAGLQSLYLKNRYGYSFVTEKILSLRELRFDSVLFYIEVENFKKFIKDLRNPTTMIVYVSPRWEWASQWGECLDLLLGIPLCDRQNLKEVTFTRNLSSSGFHRRRLWPRDRN